MLLGEGGGSWVRLVGGESLLGFGFAILKFFVYVFVLFKSVFFIILLSKNDH